MTDKWSCFADLLANLIEKYAAVLDVDNLPEPPKCFEKNLILMNHWILLKKGKLLDIIDVKIVSKLYTELFWHRVYIEKCNGLLHN